MAGFGGLLGKLDAAKKAPSNYEKGAPFRCAHCFEHKEDHVVVGDKATCLFAPTQFQSMDPAEYKAWYDAMPMQQWANLGSTGADYIRDALKKTGFAAQLMKAMPVEEEKP